MAYYYSSEDEFEEEPFLEEEEFRTEIYYEDDYDSYYRPFSRYTDGGVPALALTPEASKVEIALADFKKGLGKGLAYFTEGKVNNLPALNVLASQEQKKSILFQFPFDNVEELYFFAEQSQVGTATKTLFRLDARRSKEISNITLLNQEWNDTVSLVCKQIQQVLAPGASKVVANLYKLLIYKEGDFFHRHQDAQQADRMFATLLFFLPVEHTGGAFTIMDPENFKNNTTIAEKPSIKCAGSSDSEHSKEAATGKAECSWVAFYTDVHHEVPKITKGYRVVLNYTLTFEGAMSPSPMLSPISPSTADIITSYFSAHSDSMLAIPLRYEYTLATLSPEYLKGVDAHIYNALNQVSSPVLQFVIRFDKTRVIPMYNESDHKPVFQKLYTINHDIAKRFFDICKEEQHRLEEIDRQGKESKSDDKEIWKKRGEVQDECKARYIALMKEVKESKGAPHVEWIIKRDASGDIEDIYPKSNIYFSRGEMGWLGNMSPPEEYYYLSAALVMRKQIE